MKILVLVALFLPALTYAQDGSPASRSSQEPIHPVFTQNLLQNANLLKSEDGQPLTAEDFARMKKKAACDELAVQEKQFSSQKLNQAYQAFAIRNQEAKNFLSLLTTDKIKLYHYKSQWPYLAYGTYNSDVEKFKKALAKELKTDGDLIYRVAKFMDLNGIQLAEATFLPFFNFARQQNFFQSYLNLRYEILLERKLIENKKICRGYKTAIEGFETSLPIGQEDYEKLRDVFGVTPW